MTEEENRQYRAYIADALTEKRPAEEDEAFLIPWRAWLAEAEGPGGAAKMVNTRILAKRPVDFRSPEQVTASIYESAAGPIPILVMGDERDFEQFICNAAHKGVWTDEIKKQGASFLAGKQNRFIVLSRKPYSNIPAERMGLAEEDWREKSMILRREHECTHYYTRRFYGSAKNNLHDELMADFFGILAAFGEYREEWFDLFMGLDGRPEGRISLYTAELSEGVRAEVRKTGRKCAAFLESWSRTEEFAGMSYAGRVDALCTLGIAGMAERAPAL